MGDSPWGPKESDTTERLSTQEGNTLDKEKNKTSEAIYYRYLCNLCTYVTCAPTYIPRCGSPCVTT